MTEQRWVPGLIGMAVHTDCIYLSGLQEDAADPSALNRLRVLYHGIDFGGLVARIVAEDWRGAVAQLSEAAGTLAAGGADFLVITSGTGNTFAQTVAAASGLPVLDPVDVASAAMAGLGCRRAGLISTRRTDEAGLFHQAAAGKGIEVMSADDAMKDAIQAVIVDDLIRGVRSAHAIEVAVEAAQAFAAQGADSLILGCTDFSLIADEVQARCPLRVIDVTRLHAAAAHRAAIAGSLASA